MDSSYYADETTGDVLVDGRVVLSRTSLRRKQLRRRQAALAAGDAKVRAAPVEVVRKLAASARALDARGESVPRFLKTARRTLSGTRRVRPPHVSAVSRGPRARGVGRPAARRRCSRSSAASGDSGSDGPGEAGPDDPAADGRPS